MRKIIKNTMQEPISMTCPFCSSIFSYNFEDIRVRDVQAFALLAPIRMRFVECPVCKKDIELAEVKIIPPQKI
ncbi:MAG: hypothetical protein IKE94_07895 [Aeriscardovia sp.]|nr:hypothetical protein [Aeriscardovia sp.]